MTTDTKASFEKPGAAWAQEVLRGGTRDKNLQPAR